MTRRVVQVNYGSTWSRSVETPLFLLTEARFAPGVVLEPHTHPRPICAVMLAGSFDTRVGSRAIDCRSGTAWTEPCEEKHRNEAGRGGAHVLVVQPDPARTDVFRSLGPFLDGVHEVPRAGVLSNARAALAELRERDALTALGIDALLLGLLAKTARLAHRRERNGAAPRWLGAARDFLHAEFRAAPALDDVARAVDVPAAELASAFRTHYGRSLGAYARELRFEWAMDRLHRTEDGIAAIANDAGYADQAHFTRDCVARLGESPGRLRRLARG
jgi:AraC-like DNA-binding protein/quercetin dioxygenase-like cupin family protein